MEWPQMKERPLSKIFVESDLKSLLYSALLSPQTLSACHGSGFAPSLPLIKGVCVPQEHSRSQNRCAASQVPPQTISSPPLQGFHFRHGNLTTAQPKNGNCRFSSCRTFLSVFPCAQGRKIHVLVSVCHSSAGKGREDCFMTRRIFEGISFNP